MTHDARHEFLHRCEGGACIFTDNLEIEREVPSDIAVIHQRKLEKLGEAERPFVNGNEETALVAAEEKKVRVQAAAQVKIDAVIEPDELISRARRFDPIAEPN